MSDVDLNEHVLDRFSGCYLRAKFRENRSRNETASGQTDVSDTYDNGFIIYRKYAIAMGRITVFTASSKGVRGGLISVTTND